MTRIWLVSLFSCLVSGVSSSVVAWSMPLMWPTSVAMPVAGDDDRPAPRVTWVFMNARSTRSPRAASAATGVDLLRDREALAGQRRLVDLERRRRQDPAVGRDEVAGLDVDDVARDDAPPSATEASAPSRRTLAWTTIIFWRAATLAEALPSWLRPIAGVEQRQPDQHDAGGELAREEEAQDAGAEQHDLHRVLVLAEERLPARLLRRVGELVLARSWRWRFWTSAAVRPGSSVTAWRCERLVGRQRVPGRRQSPEPPPAAPVARRRRRSDSARSLSSIVQLPR